MATSCPHIVDWHASWTGTVGVDHAARKGDAHEFDEHRAGTCHGEYGHAGDRLTRPSPPIVLALVELTGHDAQVVKATRALAGPGNGTVIFLHVARRVSDGPWHRARWDRMAGIDAAAQRILRRLAGMLLRRNLYARTSVRFGETIEQVAKAAMAVGATVVVAASRPARWRWWWSRDRRLQRSLDIPVRFVIPRAVKGVDRGRSTPGESARLGSPRRAA
jgi:hypothetical protein